MEYESSSDERRPLCYVKKILSKERVSFQHREVIISWTASSEFGTYRLCEQRRFRRACASAQSRQNLRCSLIQTVSQEEPSDRKPDPWPLLRKCGWIHLPLSNISWTTLTPTRIQAFELPHDKTKKMTCAPSEDPDQPGHPPRLIRVFAVGMKKSWVLSYPLSAQRRLWSDSADSQVELSLRWTHRSVCWFCHAHAHF